MPLSPALLLAAAAAAAGQLVDLRGEERGRKKRRKDPTPLFDPSWEDQSPLSYEDGPASAPNRQRGGGEGRAR